MADEAVACVEALASGRLSAALKKVGCPLTLQLFSVSQSSAPKTTCGRRWQIQALGTPLSLHVN
jgi:hypothetical protein